MDLPVKPPVKPMLAKAVSTMPEDENLLFEPKWDGFRCIIFRDGDEVYLGSRNEKPLTRYFPEILKPIRTSLPNKCVVDGELIVVADNKLAFETLQQRIHPAESRVNMLAKKTPSSFVAFDMLALGTKDLRQETFRTRRQLLMQSLNNPDPTIHLTPATTNSELAKQWFQTFEGAGLDGLVAKDLEGAYAENKRAQLKVKHVRSADAVVAGYRWHKDGEGIGSLLLGLYDNGELRHVGVAASFTGKKRKELVPVMQELGNDAADVHPWREWATAEMNTGQMPGAQHRWNSKRDSSWHPVRIEKVVEVKYSTTLGGRFRDVTKMLRWREDKNPDQCTLEQLEEPKPIGADVVLSAGAAPSSHL